MNSQFGNHNAPGYEHTPDNDSQFGNHGYDPDHSKWVRSQIAKASPELMEKAARYDWSAETIASMVARGH